MLNYRGLKPIAHVAAQIAQLRASLGASRVTWGAGTDLDSKHQPLQPLSLPLPLVTAAADGLVRCAQACAKVERMQGQPASPPMPISSL